MGGILILCIVVLLLYILYYPIIAWYHNEHKKNKLKNSDFYEKQYDEELKDWGDGI